MRYRLRSYDQSPPGGYCYDEPGFTRRCRPIVEDIARELSAYRKANGRPGADIATCVRDVDSAQCARMGNNPTYCIPCDQPITQAQPIALTENAPLIAPPCKGCGAPVAQ